MRVKGTDRGPLATAVAWTLVTLLAAGAPPPLLAASPTEQGVGAPAATGLTVLSEPAGAAVYVDGDFHGKTPLSVDRVAPGDHRVRVVKEGYLENSRVLSLRAGQLHSVQVKINLTPDTADTGRMRRSVQVEEKPKKGEEKKGGALKWVLIGGGLAAAGATAYVIATKNDPPVPGSITVSPTATGMAGFTSYTFTSNASDPDKDPLTYEWNFGDGSTGSGQSTSHVYNAPGAFNVALTVKDKKHSATAPATAVTVARSMTGTWSGARELGFNATVAVNLTQDGSNLTGSMTFSGNLSGTVSNVTGTVGALTYPAAVNFTTPSFTVGALPGSFTVRFSGTTDGNGNTMTGTITSTSTALQPPSFAGTTTFSR